MPSRHHGSADVEQRRERVEPSPHGSHERREDGEADPSVDPQEERGDVGPARTAHDRLGDDPQPGEEPDGTGRQDQPARDRPRDGWWREGHPDVAQDDESERQRHRDRGVGEIDRQWQR